jgi:hypothetical protein
MPKFQYTAVNQQGNTLNGVIEAETDILAKRKLSSLKLSIVGLEPITDTDDSKSFLKYKFEATDKDNKKVIGTISSENQLDAFKKLTSEYELNVLKLASLNASQAEFDNSASAIDKLYQQINSLNQNKNNDNTKEEYLKDKQKIEFDKTISEVILLIQTILKQSSDKLKPEALEFLQKYEIHLNKIKFSENQDNISNAAKKVLNEIQNSKLFLDLNSDSQEQLELHIKIQKLNQKLRQNKIHRDEVSSFINKILAKVGLSTHRESSENVTLLDYIKLALKTESNQVRGTALLKFVNSIFNLEFLSNKSSTIVSNNTKLSKLEINLISVTNWILSILLIFYFITVFISSKIPKIAINPILLIYNTKIIIYGITAVLFLNLALKIREQLALKNVYSSKLSYPLLAILYILILLNL